MNLHKLKKIIDFIDESKGAYLLCFESSDGLKLAWFKSISSADEHKKALIKRLDKCVFWHFESYIIALNGDIMGFEKGGY